MKEKSGETKPILQVFVVLNPIAGNASAEEIRHLIERYFKGERYQYEIYETTGKENLAELTRAACSRGTELVIAAGGDGTVAGVVNGLVHTGIKLGILPVGTGNGLARALKIPLDVESAIELLAGEHDVMGLDAMQVEEKYFILNVSAGISASAMRETDPEEKQRFGILAYIRTIASELIKARPRRYNLLVDGRRIQVHASEILISNGSLLDDPLDPLGPPELFSDGKFDVYAITARSLGDYVRMSWNLVFKPNGPKQKLRHFHVSKKILIEAMDKPVPTQGDGEALGTTPIEVRVAADALQVIVPVKTSEPHKKDKEV